MSRPRALTVGATIAAGAVAALGASVAASRGGDNVTDPTTQSVVASIVVTLGGAVLVTSAVALVLFLRGRGGSAPPAQRERHSKWMQFLGVVIALSIVAIILTLIVLTAHRPTPLSVRGRVGNPTAVRHLGSTVPFNRAASGATVALIVIVAALVLLPRLVRRLRRGRNANFVLQAPTDSGEGSMQSAQNASDALHRRMPSDSLDDPRGEPEPGASIVLAYQRFVALMAASSAPRGEWETPLEYSERLAAGPFHDEPTSLGATHRLTALFNCARYGVMRMTETDRADAIDSLDLLERAGAPS